MPSLLDQLYQTKLQLVAVLTMVGGFGLLVAAQFVDGAEAGWWQLVPVGELGSTLFATGALAIFFEYADRKHGDVRTDQRIRAALRKEAPAIRDAVLDSFAFDPAALANVASPETLDRIATNALGLRLGDQALAADLYADVRAQVVAAPERWRDLRIAVTVSPWQPVHASSGPAMFVATIRREYRTRPAGRTLRFASTSDLDEYRTLLRDPEVAGQWYFEATSGLDASSPEAFAVVQLAVNGKVRPIRRSVRKDAQLYSIDLGAEAVDGREVVISYTYRAVIQQHGHLLYLDIPRPTKGLSVQLSHQGSGIRYVNVVDFIASSEQPRVLRQPVPELEAPVDISFDGWVLPRSGVAFVWVLERELKQ